MTISTYLERTDKLLNTPFTITHTGKGYYNENGVLYTREEFKRRYPIPLTLVMSKRGNADKTKRFLYED